MSETKAKPERSVPLWVKVLLGLSLALNLAVIGLVVGVLARFADQGGPRFTNYALPYVIALPKEDRREIQQHVRSATRKGDLPNRKERKADYQAMLLLLEAEAWNEEEALVILAKQSDNTTALHVAARTAWLKQVSSYTLEERKAYADRLRHVIERGSGRKQRKH